jgi:hypothetical protein
MFRVTVYADFVFVWNWAAAGVMSRSRPELEVVSRSIGIGVVGFSVRSCATEAS